MCCWTVDRLCCMRLPTAGVVIGWLHSTGSFISSVFYIAILTRLDKIFNLINDQRPDIGIKEFEPLITAFLSVYLAINIINFIAAAMLIVGTKKNSHLMLLPWLISNGIVLVVQCISVVVVIGVTVASGSAEPVFAIMILIASLGFEYWIWTAIRSLFKSIRDSKVQHVNCALQDVNASAPPDYKLFNDRF